LQGDDVSRTFGASKVLAIGSGPIVIGQAAEFDYSGTQACRALREEGVPAVLVNLNPATTMTDEGIADVVYIEPLSVEFLTGAIEVNRRVSRSSALASKAAGYPIARVAAKIAIDRRLDQIPNKVAGKTLASLALAQDYCVVKTPRWLFDKFALGDRQTGSQIAGHRPGRGGVAREQRTILHRPAPSRIPAAPRLNWAGWKRVIADRRLERAV
jgi:carbamoylphosphate synthase large subunit